MNGQYVSMEDQARVSIKASLKECTEKEQDTFKRGFSPFNKSLSTEEIVDSLHDEELNSVMQLLHRTLEQH